MRSCPVMHASQVGVSAQHLLSTSMRFEQISGDSLYVVSTFLGLFDLRRLRITSRLVCKVTSDIQIWRRLASDLWPHWSKYYRCPMRALEVYAKVLSGTTATTGLMRNGGPIAANSNTIASTNLLGHATMTTDCDFNFTPHCRPECANQLIVLQTNEVVSSNGRVMHISSNGHRAEMWIPGQVNYISPRAPHSWHAITIDGTVWSCWCINAGTARERTHVAMLSSPAQLAAQGHAGVATCITCGHAEDCWVGSTSGVYTVCQSIVKWVWQGCRVLDIEKSKNHVAAATMDHCVRVWDKKANIPACVAVFTMPYYRLSSFSSTNLFLYGPYTIDAGRGVAYGTPNRPAILVERRYTNCGKLGVFRFLSPVISKFVHIAT